MNKQDLKQALSILKSQKLLKYYDIDIIYKNDLKEYQAFWIDYKDRSQFINFPYITNKNNKISYIKDLIYENYIKQ